MTISFYSEQIARETHEAVIRFTKLLSEQCLAIERKTYTLCDKTVKFSFELLPSDMKVLGLCKW